MEDSKHRKEAAMALAVKIQQLAEEGRIKTLSITIHAWKSDDLLTLAQNAGIKEVTVSALTGC